MRSPLIETGAPFSKPIVTSAAEGYSTFRRSGIDLLVAGRCVVRKGRASDAELEEAVS